MYDNFNPCLFTIKRLALPTSVIFLVFLFTKNSFSNTPLTNNSNLDSAFSILKKTDFIAALELANQQLLLSKEKGNYKEIVSWQRKVGLLNKQIGNYNNALECFISALKLNEQHKDTLRIRQSYNDLGSYHHYLKNYDKALKYFFRSLTLNNNKSNKNVLLSTQLKIGHVYRLQKKYDTALSYYRKSQQLAFELGKVDYALNIFGDIGKLYHSKGDYDKALTAHLKCLDHRIKRNNKYGLSGSNVEIAALYYDMGKLEKAILHATQGLQFASELGNIEHQKEAYWTLYQAQLSMKNYEQAIKHLASYTSLNDSLLNKEKIKQLTELEVKYSVEQKETAIELLLKEKELQQLKQQKKNYLISAIGLVTAIFILLAFVVFRNKQYQLKEQSMKLEHRLLRSQMNPHFIFNCLVAIQSFIYKKNLIGANKFLATFSRLVRLILENSREELISFDKEVKTLTHYLEMQQLRYTNDFEYNITVDQNINQDVLKIPP